MSNNTEEKQYGLILPKKQKSIPTKVSNVFGDSNDSDEEDGTDWVKKALKAEGEKNKIKKQTKLNIQKALKEDPTIFQYDEVYDDMEKGKEQSKAIKDEKKKPRYIQNLLKAAERRKKEQEYRIERMVQKEREAEGEMFADKESFVTSAYRAKLEEFKVMEEEENKMDRLEAIGDVRKQQDISGFYRHLYEQTVKSSDESEIKDNINNDKISANQDLTNASKETNMSITKKEEIKTKEVKKNRQYRQRKVEEDSDTDTETQQTEVADKAKPISPEKRKTVEKELEPVEPDNKKQKQQIEESNTNKTDDPTKAEDTVNVKDAEKIEDKCENNDKAVKADITAKAKIEAEKRERSKIWEKRTVGSAFEAALQRYYARKSARLSAV